jgi:outer membrane protein OmpA-like peptidoglycan-associated protein
LLRRLRDWSRLHLQLSQSMSRSQYQTTSWLAALLCLELACAPYATKRDKTARGAAIGAGVGAAVGIVTAEHEADEILARAAIGAVGGAAIGAYMDHQEEQLARIPGTRVERVGKDVLLVRFESDVLFDVDSATIRDEGRETLVQVADVVDEFDKTAVVVQGHTDATGPDSHNQTLSERRAEAARDYLVGRGVDEERIEAIGYGETRPLASNETPEDRQLNRRVEILLKAKA